LLRAGRSPDHVVITERRVERADQLAATYGVKALQNAEAVAVADTVVLVVKPQDLAGLLVEIKDVLSPGALVVTIAAGITTAFVEQRLPDGVAVVRVMPNTPALVDQGMAAISAGSHCSAEHLARAEALLAATGKVVQVPEYQQDAITAISGSGPAYIFYVVEAMIEAGVLLGLPRATASELVVQTLYGAATMLKETGTHPTVLREQVSSPAGTTMAALRQLDENKVRAAFLTAMEAARDRSRELSSGGA
jgi:pyrroline-5-carboxylate reductase